ncbi:hypothetical protein PV326_005224 [Microctonus aethiopoides]|nr:hypothetical protein PV326_005224 [Microctonus aethiopoides]
MLDLNSYEKGNTPLHYAARAECTEAVRILLELGSYLGHLNILGVPPIAHINRGILQEHFDECLRSNNECTDEYEINFDYTCLISQTTSPIDHAEIRYDSLLGINSAIKSSSEPEIGLDSDKYSIVIGAGPPIGALAILLSAWELVILISQHPRMSTGIEMFKTVSMNLMAFLLPYGFLILAFAMAFFTLFRGGEDNNFPNPGQSLFKTIIMVTGEFDATDIPFVLHPVFSHIVFILFVFLIAIVLFNLLIGLAVSDTADILSRAELVGLISRTKLLCYAEKIVLGSSIMKSPKCWNLLYKYQVFRFKFFARRILLFPHYLPHTKIIVKLCKNNKIYISGCTHKTCNSTSLAMDSKIISKSKEILSTRGKITEYEKIMNALQELKLNITSLTDIMDSFQCSSAHR